MLKDFKQFIKEQNIFGAAIGIIIWLKVTSLVNSLVNDVVMPAILNPVITATGVKTLEELSRNGILYGKFISAFVDFLIVLWIVFIAVRMTNKFFGKETKA